MLVHSASLYIQYNQNKIWAVIMLKVVGTYVKYHDNSPPV